VTIKTSTLTPAHIPVAAASVCEACHSATNFTAFGPGTAMTPTSHLQVPTSLEACTTCHENGDAAKFYGVTIVTRPTATQDPSHPPAPQDCGNSGCHTTAPPFQGGVKPSNHIASSATCTNCHTGYTPATTTMNHADSGVGLAGTPVACATCHGYGAGPYYGTAQGQAGGQPLQPPGTNGGPASASQHLPFGTAACSICHKSTIVPGGFKGTTVPHTNGPFMTYTRGSGKSNTGTSTPKCNTCHAPSGAKWYGTSFSTKTEGQHASSTAPPTASTATARPAASRLRQQRRPGPSPGRPWRSGASSGQAVGFWPEPAGDGRHEPEYDAAGGHRSVLAPGCCAGQLHELPPPGRRRFCDAGRPPGDHVVVQRVPPHDGLVAGHLHARGRRAGTLRQLSCRQRQVATPKPAAHFRDGPLVRCVPPQHRHLAAGDVRPPEPAVSAANGCRAMRRLPHDQHRDGREGAGEAGTQGTAGRSGPAMNGRPAPFTGSSCQYGLWLSPVGAPATLDGLPLGLVTYRRRGTGIGQN